MSWRPAARRANSQAREREADTRARRVEGKQGTHRSPQDRSQGSAADGRQPGPAVAAYQVNPGFGQGRRARQHGDTPLTVRTDATEVKPYWLTVYQLASRTG